MRTLLQKPAIQIGLKLALLLAAVEGSLYFDNHRHATLRDLTITAIFGLVYFAVLEGLSAKGFIIRGRETWLYMFLTFSGFTDIVSLIQKMDNPSTTWAGRSADFLFGLIFNGLIGASIDAVVDYRRRSRTQQ